jgi:O-antigen ligase
MKPAGVLSTLTDVSLSRRFGRNLYVGPVDARDKPVRIALAVGAFAAVAATAASSGAYFPTSWGWAAVAFGWAAVILLVVPGGVRLSRLDLVTLATLWGLTGWTALSSVWSESPSQSVLETERSLIYATALLAALLAARRAGARFLVGGVLCAIVVISSYALATRLFPERLAVADDLSVNRLQQPVGYWNALGVFASMGVLLALGFAARAQRLATRGIAAGALPILALTLYFAFGRGAWIALGVGLLAAIALDVRRLQFVSALIVLVPGPALAVWLASQEQALTSRTPVLAEASRAGHRFVPVVLGLALATGVCGVLLARVEERSPLLPRARRAYTAAIWSMVVACVAAVVVAYGSPWAMTSHAYDQFTAAPAPVRAAVNLKTDLNQRLFSLWGNGRADFWRVAWQDAREHPWLGSGAGTFQEYWLRHRPIAGTVRDAHNLYLETFAELGLPGIALLAVALGLPMAAAIRARRGSLVAATAGAYVVYLSHAGADWDWEMPAVTLAALLIGVSLLVSARGNTTLIRVPFRIGLGALCIAAAAFSFVGLVSNTALSENAKATSLEDWPKAEAEARTAIAWAPWSTQGWQALGEAQLAQGKLPQARSSFRQALTEDRRNWNLWLDLALASSGAERRSAALIASRLNPLSPEIAQARKALGLAR